jgi:hypothetical protein
MKTGLIFKDKTVPHAPVRRFTKRDIVDEIKKMIIPIEKEDKPMGEGSASNPYRMHSVKQWAAAARDPAAEGKDLYDIAGQLNERGYRSAAKDAVITAPKAIAQKEKGDSVTGMSDDAEQAAKQAAKQAERERQARLVEAKRIKEAEKNARLAEKRARDQAQRALAMQRRAELEGATSLSPQEIAEQPQQAKALKKQKQKAQPPAEETAEPVAQAIPPDIAGLASAFATISATDTPDSTAAFRPSPTSSPPPAPGSPPASSTGSPRYVRRKTSMQPSLPTIYPKVPVTDAPAQAPIDTADPAIRAMPAIDESRHALSRWNSQPHGLTPVGDRFDRRLSQGEREEEPPQSPLWATRPSAVPKEDAWASIASSSQKLDVQPERKASQSNMSQGSAETKDTRHTASTTFSTRWVNYITAVASPGLATVDATNGISPSGRARLHPIADTKERAVYARKYERLQAEFRQRYSEENQPYSNESMSREMANELRSILEGEPTRSYARSELPGTTAALFLGEVARSQYMLPLGLMELDLVQIGAEYGTNEKKIYTFEKMLSDPNNPTSREGAKHPMARDGSSKLSRNMFDLKKGNPVRDRAISIVASWLAHSLSNDSEWSVAIDRTVDQEPPPVAVDDVTAKKKGRSKQARRKRAELAAQNQLKADSKVVEDTNPKNETENAEPKNMPVGKTKADFREKVASLLKKRCATFDCLLIAGNTIRYSIPPEDQPWLGAP